MWRTGIQIACFSFFAIGGIGVSTLCVLYRLLWPGSVQKKQRHARKMVNFFFRGLLGTLRVTGCMQLVVHDVAQLATLRQSLVLANHPSYLDVVVLLALMPEANCLVKGALWKNPFFWGIVRATGYVQNTSPEQALDACAEAISAGDALILFPEGTRTVPGESMKFQRGAAHVALRATARVVPVLLHCTPPTLTKGASWWLAPAQPFVFTVRVLAQTDVSQLIGEVANPSIGARKLSEALHALFQSRLTEYGYA
ncbi:lysophospholipid acyltransferase family protein [Leeia sp.]|uniref:lysophospholipid acyltransferase family protein n=1 Tax=Leeia sp. TaxID=2884678 RepID=UPI0035B1FFE0